MEVVRKIKTDLAVGNDSALARIAKVRNAKAEIHWPTNVLRITADKNTAEYTADDIEATLSKAHTTVFHPQRWIEQLDKDRASNLAASLPVNYVSSLTGAHIVATNNDNVRPFDSVPDVMTDRIRLQSMHWTKLQP